MRRPYGHRPRLAVEPEVTRTAHDDRGVNVIGDVIIIIFSTVTQRDPAVTFFPLLVSTSPGLPGLPILLGAL